LKKIFARSNYSLQEKDDQQPKGGGNLSEIDIGWSATEDVVAKRADGPVINMISASSSKPL